MSSRTRYYLRTSTGNYVGGKCRAWLRDFTGLPVNTKDEMIAAANVARAKLWIFREPRLAQKKRSRYKMLCAYYGIGKKIKKALAPGDVAAYLQDYHAVAKRGIQHGANPAGQRHAGQVVGNAKVPAGAFFGGILH